MDNGRALLAGAVVVGAALWWYAGHPGFQTAEQRRAHIAQIEAAEGSAGGDTGNGPKLYRCPGADGVNTITDSPPPGRKCTQVHVRPDQNVVSLQVEPPAAP